MPHLSFPRPLNRALQDIGSNGFLHAITVAIIGLVLLILAAFIVIFMNVNRIAERWQADIRIVAYVKEGVDQDRISLLHQRIKGFYGVNEAVFVSADEALVRLRSQMRNQAGVLDGLKENPLPASFEISLNPVFHDRKSIEGLAAQVRETEDIGDVQYGEAWLNLFLDFFAFFETAGFITGGLLLLVAIYIVSNTIKLTLFARKDELEIMQLVGATRYFIKLPFYIQGILQGLAGALISLVTLYVLFSVFVSRLCCADLPFTPFRVWFLSKEMMGMVVLLGVLTGWVGSYLSLRKFLRAWI